MATGATPTHFWMQVRDSVHDARVSGDDVVIGIDHVGFRQRLEGGTITAGAGHEQRDRQADEVPRHPGGRGLGTASGPSDFPEGALQYIVGPGGPALILAEHTDRIATKRQEQGKICPRQNLRARKPRSARAA